MNTISQACYQEPPPELYGGILADPMGLGKTLTMIALAAIDVASDGSARHDQDERTSSRPTVPTTLIIVPPSREWDLNLTLLCMCSYNLQYWIPGRNKSHSKAGLSPTRWKNI